MATSTRTRRKPAASKTGVIEVPIGAIDTHPWQTRQTFDEAELQTLAASIERDSLLQPPVVRPLEDNRWQLVAGERRLRAAKLAGCKTIQVNCRALSDVEALRTHGVENVLRKEWNAMELADYLTLLCRKTRDGGAGLTQKEAAELFGHTQAWAGNLVRLLELPEPWQRRVESGSLTAGQARALLPYKDQPATLSAIESDMAENPWAWRTREDVERNAALVADVDQPAEKPPTAATRATAADGERSSTSQTASAEGVQSSIDTRRVVNMLMPFAHDRKSLLSIRDIIDRLLTELDNPAV